MAITLTGGNQIVSGHSWGSVETLTQSTATTPQALSLKYNAHVLGGGTATGTALRNLYTVAAGVEGQEKVIFMSTATGEASVIATFATGRQPFDVGLALNGGTATTVDAAHASATGQLVFQSDGDYVRMRYMNTKWHLLEVRGATVATTT